MHSNRRIFSFNHFRKLGGFIRSIYFGEISLRHAIERQNYIEDLLRSLNGYKPKKQRKMQSKKEVLENAQKSFDGRRRIVYVFEKNIFLLPSQPIKDMNRMLLIYH